MKTDRIASADINLSGCLSAMATRPLESDVSGVPGEEIILDVGDYEQVLVFVYAGASTELMCLH